jgi:hypothetical protein
MLQPGGRLLLADAYLSGPRGRCSAWPMGLKQPGAGFVIANVRRYAPTLRKIGFDQPELVDTGTLVSVKPMG